MSSGRPRHETRGRRSLFSSGRGSLRKSLPRSVHNAGVALPPQLIRPPPGLLKDEDEVLESNRFSVPASGLSQGLLEETLRVSMLVPFPVPVRIAWRWTGGDHGGLEVWLRKARPGRRYWLRFGYPGFRQDFFYRASAAPRFEAKPDECVWLPPFPWEAFFWKRLRRAFR